MGSNPTAPTKIGPVAQWIEHLPSKQMVACSNHAGIAKLLEMIDMKIRMWRDDTTKFYKMNSGAVYTPEMIKAVVKVGNKKLRLICAYEGFSDGLEEFPSKEEREEFIRWLVE